MALVFSGGGARGTENGKFLRESIAGKQSRALVPIHRHGKSAPWPTLVNYSFGAFLL